MDDSELLAMVGDERRNSIGFNHDQDLSADRTRALEYIKGEMKDLATLDNRSKAMTSDVSDAVETILPDLIEIFVGGEDIATFRPRGAEDEEAAAQETDYVNHVVMQENDGFNILYAAFKDALTVKTGVFKWEWEDTEESDEQEFEGIDAVQVQMLVNDGWQLVPGEPRQDDLYNVKATKSEMDGELCVSAVPAEDFTVARDTVRLREATYCAMRARPRAQDLIADGYDADKVRALTTYGQNNDNSVQTARDDAGEGNNAVGGEGDLRQVEIVEHYLRLKDGKSETIWRIVTGNNEDVLLEKDEVDMIPFASITPYPIAHRFYGRSVPDLLMEIQRIKTAILRMFLDSGYFAMNQRYEVADAGSNEWTIPDLLRNEPGMPVRVKQAGTVNAINAGSFNFPALEALEYASVMGEGRSGIVRNAQGMNPDTLHDTAKGAMALMGAAQKRVRMIARIFAETGVKDLFLGVHATLRAHGTKSKTTRLRGKWVDVDPSQWGARNDMTVEIGIGSGGKDMELAMMDRAAAIMQQLVQMQGGPSGPLVTLDNVYAFTKRLFEKGLGFKSADLFLSDPKEAAQGPQEPPPPDPAIVKAQMDQQTQQQKMELEATLKREQMDGEFKLKKYQIDMEARLKAAEVAMGGQAGNGYGGGVHFGGNPG